MRRGLFWKVYLHGLFVLTAATASLVIVGFAFGRHGGLHAHLAHIALVLWLVFVVLAFGSIPLARQITSPLTRLTGAVERFGGGDLTARAGFDRNDEVGQLARAFDDMASRVERLVRSEKEFLASVSHELRTPLARVRVALEIAAEGDERKARACLAEIAADLGEIEALVGDVLTAARLDLARGRAGTEAGALRRSPLASETLVEQAASRFRAAHPDRPLEVETEATLPALEADPALLRRALGNLLENAHAYSDAGREVRLVARADGDALVLEVKDRGIGIAPEDRERLFTPFFRADRSRARNTGGVGMGLALARGIVEAHGGTIEVESAAGEGSTFRIRLPGRAGTSAGDAGGDAG